MPNHRSFPIPYEGRTTPGQWELLKPAARRMRREPTEAEAALWHALRGSQAGAKFRRQYAIHHFIVDFYCPQAGLVVEVDGPIHEGMEAHDAERQVILEGLGLRVLRFTNEEVLHTLEGVVQRIKDTLGAA